MYKGQLLPENVRYIELPDRDYNCTGVEDESIDFAFSFGVFCHLPNSANETYVNSIYKKLKVGGVALLAFADFYRHFLYSEELWDGEEDWMEDKELQERFWLLFGPSKIKSPNLRIGADFLRKNKDFIN